MDLKHKVESVAVPAIRSITRHDDEDVAVRKHAISLIRAELDAEEQAMDARNAARITETFGAAQADPQG